MQCIEQTKISVPPERKPLVINNEECYVAFLDILGFKEYVKSTDPDDVLKIFQDLQKVKERLARDILGFAQTDEIKKIANTLPQSLYLYIMSDSVILAINCCHEGALHFLIRYCQIMQEQLLSKYHLLLRGGISKGIYYGDQTINFGRGMIKAYEFEGKAKYPRILIDEKILSELKPTPIPFINCSYEIKTETIEKHDIHYINVANNILLDLLSCCKWITDETRKQSGVLEKYRWLEQQLYHEIEKNDAETQDKIAEEEYFKEVQSNENPV